MVELCADAEEALECCAAGMARTMDEIDPDPVQLDADEPSDAAYVELAEHCRAEGMLSAEESEAILSKFRYGNSHIGDGVEWETASTRAMIGPYEAYIYYDSGTAHYIWIVTIEGDEEAGGSGAARTLEEARRQVVAAARGMNNGAY